MMQSGCYFVFLFVALLCVKPALSIQDDLPRAVKQMVTDLEKLAPPIPEKISQGELEASLDSYDEFIDNSFLEAVAPAEWPEAAMEEEAMEEEAAEEAPAAASEKPDPPTIAMVGIMTSNPHSMARLT